MRCASESDVKRRQPPQPGAEERRVLHEEEEQVQQHADPGPGSGEPPIGVAGDVGIAPRGRDRAAAREGGVAGRVEKRDLAAREVAVAGSASRIAREEARRRRDEEPHQQEPAEHGRRVAPRTGPVAERSRI